MPLKYIKKLINRIPWIGPALRNRYQEMRRRSELRRYGPEYHRWISGRVATRGPDYPAPVRNRPWFDILTLTFETDPDVLRKTARSVFEQDYPQWRWVVWDNASTRPETLAVLDELARHPQVLLHKSPKNLGITEGHAKALALCEHEYVALLDHDDLICADALRINACTIDRYDRPDFLYSDEDKCDMQERRSYPFFKPDLSPAFLLDTGYTCHFAVVGRQRLLACGAFQDKSVEGTQDWDMALRLVESGCRTVHIPEVLYTWRAVPQSTAIAGVSAKPYVIDAQRNCLNSALVRRGLAGQFEVRPNPLFPTPDGHWRMYRRNTADGPLIDLAAIASGPQSDWKAACKSLLEETVYPRRRLRMIDVYGDERIDSACRELREEGHPVFRESLPPGPMNLARTLNALLKQPPAGEPAAPFLAFIPPGARIITPDWLWEALTCLELHSDAALVGGRRFGSRFNILGGPALFGAGGLMDVAYARNSHTEPGYFCLNWCHRNVVAVTQSPWVLRRAAALDVGGFDAAFSAVYYDVDLAARCHRAGWQVIYSPFVQSQGEIPSAVPEMEEAEAARLFHAHYELIRDDPFYCPFLSLEAESAFQIAKPHERAARLNRRQRTLRIDAGQSARCPPSRSDVYELFRHCSKTTGR